MTTKTRILAVTTRKKSKGLGEGRGSFGCMRPFAQRLALGMLLSIVGAPVWFTGVAAAQTAPAVDRTVVGTVVSKGDKPVAGAVVYLQNSKTMAIKSYLTDDAGRFHFGQLAQSTDYEIWAESNGQRSRSKNISLFDSKNAFNFTLKVDKADR